MFDPAPHIARYLQTTPPEFPCHVAVRMSERAWGGPEEGGWSYERYREYVHAKYVTDRAEWEAHVRVLFEMFDLRFYSHSSNPRAGQGYESIELVSRTSPFPVGVKHYAKPQYE